MKISDKNGTQLTDRNQYVGTGMTVKGFLNNEELKTVVSGDVDGDGTVTPADARLALRAAIDLQTLEGAYFEAACVIKEAEKETITPADARKILRVALELESAF